MVNGGGRIMKVIGARSESHRQPNNAQHSENDRIDSTVEETNGEHQSEYKCIALSK